MEDGPVSAEIVLSGEAAVRSGTLRAASIAVRSGVVRLGDPEKNKGSGLAATVGNINFHAGSTLVTEGGMSLVSLAKRGNTLAFYAGSTLDVSAHPLAVGTGRLLLHGVLRIGGMDDDPFLLNYVSVDQGNGRAAIGPGFRVEFADSFLSACRDCPESLVPNAVIVDATVTRISGGRNNYWEQIVETSAGRFRIAARLGVCGDEGGGVRLSYLR